MKPIEVIAWFNEDDYPIPLRYKIESEDMSNVVIKVKRVVFKDEERLGRNRTFIYRCEGIINENQKIFELKYELSTCKWYLYKI